jgi:uncharacterized repeat protein (TIGR01451 family)
MKFGVSATCIGLLIGHFVIAGVHAQAPAESLSIKAVAEVETVTREHGREVTKLVAADRVVSGDEVIYTLEIRNPGPTSVRRPVVTYPVPEHMTYVADSAVGPATEVSYSIDGGRSFDAPESLRIQDPGSEPRLARAASYTHIRWQLKNVLKANSVAFVRFRARVK